MTDLTFLGTGGGRFTTVSQLRQTGGLYLRDRGLEANIDPGPGALVHMHRYGLDPTRTNTVLVSHGHPDHYNDAGVLIEGMTRGGLDDRGTLVASRSIAETVPCPDGRDIGPALTAYHRGLPKTTHIVEPGDQVDLHGMYQLTATPQWHSDPTTVGFKIRLTHGQFSYIPDTAYHDELAEAHKGSRMVVCQMTRSGNQRIPWHMCTDDVERLAEQIRPKLLLLTLFGYKTLKDGDPGDWAQRITERTGVPTVAARDGLNVSMDSEFTMQMGPLTV